MGRNPPRPDTSENPEPPRGGEVVCFGFLTYCLLLMVDQLPPRNGGAAVLETVETVEMMLLSSRAFSRAGKSPPALFRLRSAMIPTARKSWII